MSVCVRCGADFPEREVACPACGTLRPGRLPMSTAGSLQPVQPEPAPDSESKTHSTFVPKEPLPKKKDRDYTKLGGWMLFYIIILSGFSFFSLISGFRTALTVGGSISLLRWTTLGANVMTALATLASMVLLVRRKAIFMPVFFITSAVRFVYWMVALIVAFIWLFSVGPGPNAYNAISDIVNIICLILVFAFMPTFYFQREKRVRVYIGSDDYIARYPWVKTVLDKINKPPIVSKKPSKETME